MVNLMERDEPSYSYSAATPVMDTNISASQLAAPCQLGHHHDHQLDKEQAGTDKDCVVYEFTSERRLEYRGLGNPNLITVRQWGSGIINEEH